MVFILILKLLEKKPRDRKKGDSKDIPQHVNILPED